MKKYLSIIFVTLTIAGSSCKKDYLNLTANPNVPSTASANLLLSGAIKSTASIVNYGPTPSGSGDYAQYAAWVGYLTQSTSFQVFNNLTKYILTSTDYNGSWEDNYLNIANYNAIEATNSGPNYQAIAEIMICFDYEALVDNFNNVPYSQALKGASNLSPAYDNGQTIYLDLAKRLDAAITLIQGAPAGAANPLGADVMFGGNMTEWAKFANTLKLRLALRESTKPGLAADYATLSASVKATEGVGYIDGTFSASVNPGYTLNDANGGQESPVWSYFGTNQNGGAEAGKNLYQANAFAANYFASNKDPRLGQIYANSATPNAYKAVISAGNDGAISVLINGTDTTAIASTQFGGSVPIAGTIDGKAVLPYIVPSLLGPGVLASATQNAIIMSSPEALFLQAEGTLKGILTKEGTAASLYNAGVKSSFELDLVPNADAAAATYLANQQPYPSTGSATVQLNAIIMQKWAALAIYGGFEAFNEQRRTGIPAAALSVYPGVNAPRQVTRVFYPTIEYQTNAANVASQGTINVFSSLIFWAQ
ncbi:SusD/RagB family nutrient-binding outer membrane lipoprotein [Mucilaginibacter sp.]